MKLFANGSSYTWGAEILKYEFNLPSALLGYLGVEEKHDTFRSENVWPFHLHKLLDTTEFYNLSLGGASNQRIIRTTLEFFTNKIENDEDLSDYLAVIQWTHPSRYEIYDEQWDTYLCIAGSSITPPVDDVRKKKLLYKFYEHPKNFDDEYFCHLIFLDSFFKLHKIKYIFCTCFPLPLIKTQHHQKMYWLGTSSETNCVLPTKNFRYPGGHPDLEGHKIIAKRLYSRFQELYNL